MTTIYEKPRPQGGVRLLVLGAGHYPNAQVTQGKVPILPDIRSATRSALDFAFLALTDWAALFPKPVSFVRLLANDASDPGGVLFPGAGAVPAAQVDAPTLDNVIAARSAWLAGATPDDILVFYCCGHGIWMPSIGRTFLASDFGADPESVWPKAISLDRFAEGLGDKRPREQWLIFDCCANEPPRALVNATPATNALIETMSGVRLAMTRTYGPLIQAIVAASSPGQQAFGRSGGRSRLMDVLIEACKDAGFRDQADDGRWQLTLQGLEAAMSTYRFRVAAEQDRDYYTFARLASSDSEQPPVFMVRPDPARCTILVTSEPPIRLKQCALDLYCKGARIDGQQPGPAAEARFRRVVDSFESYQVDAEWPPPSPDGLQSRTRRGLPPLTEFKF